MRRGLLIALSLSLSLAVSASPALAKKKGKKKPARLGPVVTVTATGPDVGPTSLESTAVANCPAGTKVVGGGFSAPYTSGSSIVVHDSFKSSPTAWTVVGHLVDGSGAATATALCRKIPKGAKLKIETTTQTASVPPSFATASAEALCPDGKRPIGGGFRSEVGTGPIDMVVPTRNHPTATGWSVTGLNAGLGDRSLTAEAYCAAKVKKLSYPATSAAPFITQTTLATVTSPVCPVHQGTGKSAKKKKKKKVVPRLSGGGWDFGEVVSGGPLPFAPQSLPGAGAWEMQISNAVAFAGSPAVSVQAVCF